MRLQYVQILSSSNSAAELIILSIVAEGFVANSAFANEHVVSQCDIGTGYAVAKSARQENSGRCYKTVTIHVSNGAPVRRETGSATGPNRVGW